MREFKLPDLGEGVTEGQVIRIMLEEDAFFDGEDTWYIDGRQTELWLIPR